MSLSWKITAHAPRAAVEAALLAHEEAADWDADIVIAGSEVAESRPDDWQFEAWLPRAPTQADREAIGALFPESPPPFEVEALPVTDWVTESQQLLEPIRAGQFHVRTPDHPEFDEPGVRTLTIPASQAFGTGQHATTAGCLAMLSHMKVQGCTARNIADIGTGTGLLAFAAMRLWPHALTTASDIDPVCIDVVTENAARNRVKIGPRSGELTVLVADGMDHPLLEVRGPYDLLIANILAGPLIQLAPAFSRSVRHGGNLVLAGLLEKQEKALRAAYLRVGFRLAARLVNGDWSILWLRRRAIR